jgi:hypothetical protein
MKSIIAILVLLRRWLNSFWEFFCRWFLPPPYPPDPPADDVEGQTAIQVERQNRVGWATGLVDSDTPIQDAVLADEGITRRPIYPTATGGPEAARDWTPSQEAPIDPVDPTAEAFPDEDEAPRPSDRPLFLEEDAETTPVNPEPVPTPEDPMVAMLTRKPEGDPVARGTKSHKASLPQSLE